MRLISDTLAYAALTKGRNMIVTQLEPDASYLPELAEAVEASKAISLRRIADALEAQNEMTRTLLGDIA